MRNQERLREVKKACAELHEALRAYRRAWRLADRIPAIPDDIFWDRVCLARKALAAANALEVGKE